jgi:FkbM family methyltransferase
LGIALEIFSYNESSPSDLVSPMLPETPLVTVGIPTFQRPHGLDRVLSLICGQTYRNIEILVSDNGSCGPATLGIINKWQLKDSRVRGILQPRNAGANSNYDFLLNTAKGTLFMWAADDDEWAPWFVEECVQQCLAGNCSAMPYFDVLTRADGQRSAGVLPSFEMNDSKSIRIEKFLENPQPSLIYGLHFTKDLRFYSDVPSIDFADCYIVLILLAKRGFRLIPKVGYTAGIDTEKYEIKYSNSETRRLEFGPYFILSSQLLFGLRDISLREQFRLWATLIRSLCRLIRHHEGTAAPFRHLLTDTLRALRTRSWRSLVPSRLQNERISETPIVNTTSFSQSGEDRIIRFVFDALRIAHPTYLDIGAHDPLYLNNTHLFYAGGSRGVNVEANPELMEKFHLQRPLDVNINAAVSRRGGGSLPFYVMSTPTLSTLSRDEALRYSASGAHSIAKEIPVQVVDINEIVRGNFMEDGPDLLSVDVEGMDEEIILSINFSLFRPKVICVETLTYSETREESQISGIKAHLLMNGYFVYANTYINTIFVDELTWKQSA